MSAFEVAPSPTDAAGSDGPRCRCGHRRDHYMVSAVPHYTILGWCLFIFGVSAPIASMDFRCRQCDQVFESTRDPDVMERYRRRA